MSTQDDDIHSILHSVLEIKASITYGVTEYFKRKDSEKSEKDKNEKTKTELTLSLALLSFITGTLIVRKDSAEKIGLVKIAETTLNAYELILILISLILLWIFLYTILLQLNNKSRLYKFYIKIINFPLPIFGILSFISFFTIVVYSPKTPVIIPLNLSVLLLIVVAISIIMGLLIGHSRKPIEPNLLLNIQPKLVSVTEDGTQLCASIINNSTKKIEDIILTLTLPNNLLAEYRNDKIHDIREKFSLSSGQIYALSANIISTEERFKGKTEYIKIKIESVSQYISEEKEVPVFI